MAIRTYKVTLDSKNTIAPEPVYLRQGDKTGAVVIDATLMDNGSPVSLNGLTPMFKANTADGQAVIADSTGFNIVNDSGGEFTYQVPNALSAVPGKIVTAYFSFSDASGSESTFDVCFIIKKAVDITKPQADEYITIIDGTLDLLHEKMQSLEIDLTTILNNYNTGNFYNKSETDSKDNVVLSSSKTYTDSSIYGIKSLPETFANFAAIQSKYPNGANGVMVAADNGHKYIWNGTEWADSGVYQAVGIAEGSVTGKQIANNSVTGSKLSAAVQSGISHVIANDRLTYAITDSQDNRSWIEIDPDGNPTTNSAQRIAPKVIPELFPDQGSQAGVSFSIVDSDGKISDLAIDDNGRLLIDTVADQATRANLMTKTDMSVIRAIGDSLTDGGGGSPNPSWTETLQADLPSVKVENFGISGQASGMVTFRMGLNHVTITEIDGGKLPGDGSKVTVTFKSSIGDGRNMLNGGAFCKLNGVQAYFIATDTNKGTIKLTKPSVDVPVTVPIALMPDTDVGRYSDGKTDLDKMAIIWMGKNDSIFATGKGWEDGCMANIKAVINSLSPQIKSYILIGITNDSTEGVGTSRYSEIIKFNARMDDLTPGYVDLRSYMVHQCIYDMGLTPTEDDLASMAVDAPPAQIMRPDHTHFIAEARPFESRYILKQLQMRGWYKNDNATQTA